MGIKRTVVVGNGPFGSATTRHLAMRGVAVTCIGASTPAADDDTPTRVYSSHNDRARLTRRQDRNERWAATTARALAGYEALEAASGIDFHRGVGCLISSRLGGDGNSPDPRLVMDSTGVDYTYWTPGDDSWREQWPDLAFPASHYVAYEAGPAGHIDPIALIAAQNEVANQHGAEIIIDTVTAIDRRSDEEFRVTTAGGLVIEASRVVIAAGAFANVNGLLPEPLPLDLKSEVIVLGEVIEAEAVRLVDVPTVKYLVDGPALEGIYMIGPLRYPDGRWYVKMGANTSLDHRFSSTDGLAAIQQWFCSDTDDQYLPIYEPAMRVLWPGLDFLSFRTQPCIITYAPDRYPIVEQVGPGCFVVAAGNGAGVKCSDAIGEHAAALILDSTATFGC